MDTIVANPTQKTRDYSDFHSECRDHMLSNNISFDGIIIADSRIHRFSSLGDRRNQDEWYYAFSGVTRVGNPYLTVVYGSWKSEADKPYKYSSFDSKRSSFSEEEKREFTDNLDRARKQYEIERSRGIAQGKVEAQKIWHKASNAQVKSHDYLKAKQVDGSGLRLGEYKGNDSLLVPLYNSAGELCNIQHIYADGALFSKRPVFGAQKKGAFHVIDSRNISSAKRIYVAEGWATAQTVYQVLDKKYPVVMAIDAGNILPVIQIIKEKNASADIVIAADNDVSNKGQCVAQQATRQYNCMMVLPSRIGWDFNDIYCALGKEATLEELVPLDRNLIEKIKSDAREFLLENDPCEDFTPIKTLERRFLSSQ